MAKIKLRVSATIENTFKDFIVSRRATLNRYGLISTYRDAVATQLNLYDEDSNEPHAYCEIVEIWRRLP